ncbi:DUF5004 domain-containing protein [Olivibacter ginsenosidimutans]|uniref:DUF5004 domain-containing protein n=2 Tax=Olivibacter ginsenosidimutans TaxID=1176537 RepID=A0ABP9CD62_9SPHI
MLYSCKTDEIATVESVKQIQGSWQITKATRNGTDITEKFDFSPFRITFQADGNYQIEHALPFIVAKDGAYALDDPQYPFQIKFKEAETNREVGSSFDYPIVGGTRNLSLTFSAGCSSNTYVYTLVKTIDQ